MLGLYFQLWWDHKLIILTWQYGNDLYNLILNINEFINMPYAHIVLVVLIIINMFIFLFILKFLTFSDVNKFNLIILIII